MTGRNPNVRKILAVAAAAALLVTATAGAGAADEDAQYPTFDEISPLPLDAVTAPGSSTGTGPNGEPYLYFVSSGSPAVLSVVDVGDGSRVDEHPLPGASGSWMVETAPDGTVYVGSYGEGRLYRYFPAEQRVEDLGTPVAGETFIWALVVATDGTVYGGTGQQGAHVFSYDPDTGETRDYGALADDPSQPLVTHGIAVDEDTIYAGTGAVPRLFKIDIDSGERTELTVPEPVAELKYVYDMDLRGDLLFLRASPDGAPQPLHVYDTATGEWIQQIDGAHGLSLSAIAPDGHSVYFVKDRTLYVYDLTERSYEPTELTDISDVRGIGFLDLSDPDWPGQTLVGADYKGGYWLYSPQTGESDKRVADAYPAPAPIRSITEGPDGKVYAGAYLAGGLASYDPLTGEKRAFGDEVGQAEGMTTHAGKLYVGTYPGGDIWSYDPDRPDEPGVNPVRVLSLKAEHHQSRPYAMASAGRYLAIGTVAENGRAGGGLTLYDPETGEYWFDDVVPGHSVVGLAFHDGVLYGTTSVYGGVGGPDPTDSDAVVFAYDVEAREKVWEMVPMPGEGALGQITFDAAGKLWSHSPASVFRVDVDSRTVEDSRTYIDYPWDSIAYAHVGARLWLDPYDGDLYVVSQAKMYRIDTETLDRVRYFQPASHGFLHNNGNVYLARDTLAWEYTPNERPHAQLSVTADDVAGGQEQTVTVTGLGAGEPVEVWLRPDARLLASLTADADGTVEYTYVVDDATDEVRDEQVEVRRVGTRGLLHGEYTVSPVTCTETISGVHNGIINVATGTTCLDDAEVRGNIVVADDAALVVTDSTVNGTVTATGASRVDVTTTSVRGAVAIDATSGPVRLRESTVNGSVSITGSTGPAPVVSDTRIRGSLHCDGNVSVPHDDGVPNSVDGAATGQCAQM